MELLWLFGLIVIGCLLGRWCAQSVEENFPEWWSMW